MKEYELSMQIKELVENREFEEGKKLTAEAMMQEPDSAVPHNLLGIILEVMGDHVGAMKHFRAANALDPAYIPPRCNMDNYGSFGKDAKKCAYNTEDCPTQIKPETFKKEYDSKGIMHIVRRSSNV